MRILFKDSPYHGQRQYEKPVNIYPAHLAMFATKLRNEGNDVVWMGKDDGNFDRIIENDLQIDEHFENLPIPDRVFTNAMKKKYLSYGNYKFFPGTHLLSSNLCWYAGRNGCTFCVDSKRIIDGEHRGVRSVDHVISEIDDCIRLGFKEVFDDAGTIPIGKWLEEFCMKMKINGRNKKIKIGCNMKPLEKVDYKMMKEAGFRFILVGIESDNQFTIDKIKKGQDSSKVKQIIKNMSDAGLEPHGTFMCGYPWESENDEQRTIDLCNYLLKKGHLKTAQASVYSPPRTPPDPKSPGHKYLPNFFDAYKSPEFWYHKIKDIQRFEDFTYLLRGGRLVIEEKWRKMWLKKSV